MSETKPRSFLEAIASGDIYTVISPAERRKIGEFINDFDKAIEALRFYAQKPVPDKQSLFAKSAEAFGENVVTWEPLIDMGELARATLRELGEDV